MAREAFPKIKAADTQRVLNVRGDPPDIRDHIYEPALVRLKSEIDNREPGLILDQGQEGACTGFGLTAVINLVRGGMKNDHPAHVPLPGRRNRAKPFRILQSLRLRQLVEQRHRLLP